MPSNLPTNFLTKEVGMRRKALIVVDVQNDFCPGGALAVTDGDQVVEPLNKLLGVIVAKSDWSILFSRDWHPAVTNHFKNYGGIWPVHCVQDTKGAEFHPKLYNHLADDIISKATKPDENGYSPLGDNAFVEDFFGPTNPDEYLRKRNVTDIYIGGLATDYCVKDACLDALKLDYTVYLLTDACRAVNLNPDDGEKAIQEMKDAGVIMTTTEEVLRETR